MLGKMLQRGDVEYIKENADRMKGVVLGGAEDTALILAAENGHVEVVKALIPYEAGKKCVTRRNALYYASYNGHVECVRELLNSVEGQDVDNLVGAYDETVKKLQNKAPSKETVKYLEILTALAKRIVEL